MADVRIGCQTFTWEMLGEGFNGGPDDLLDAIAAGGYGGIEITDTMIGAYGSQPEAFARALDARGLALVAFTFSSASGFTEIDEVERDLETARRWANFAARFPGAVLSMGSATVMSGGPREEKFRIAAEVYNRASEIGSIAGIEVAVHPSSHHDTLLFDRADYDALFKLLDPASVGWVPDTGHILRGGMDMLDTLRTHAARIRYLHLKDVDATGTWAMLGRGACDVPAVIAEAAKAPGFNGWLVLEEESEEAASDPARAVRTNRETMRRFVS
ncbi:sugar phosphate isomerase/epimerase family protein [Aureimonas phyllosphaerae]|uniref:Sugar phosphate isomerase/epimerase n=1 Tax=Aureimonas phyllosphaerae TaxID=1166078 RepID=A0A7W6FSK6_9HYPH|nr:sugar phosphate isomerase/epimerase [Aureimonas phyllosphaerae]MBB3934259.1 sugar phosphate isomerase/epimerase [Aureimonas phyllosphaerae]MBB3958525.1 sugar phosphate isomerase/epimerase [Aureimonas phyllosphaerae]SFE98344.1 Sugar phosphate isomerase/epimerase [Aureimonas phyllosphaerae]